MHEAVALAAAGEDEVEHGRVGASAWQRGWRAGRWASGTVDRLQGKAQPVQLATKGGPAGGVVVVTAGTDTSDSVDPRALLITVRPDRNPTRRDDSEHRDTHADQPRHHNDRRRHLETKIK